MINRELIRIKVLQLVYAYYQNGYNNIDNAEKELFFSLSKKCSAVVFVKPIV